MKPSSSCASARCVCVAPDDVHSIWPKVNNAIRLAMERGDLGQFDDVQTAVFAGHALIWLAWDSPEIIAVCVTQIEYSQKSKSCTIVAASGENWPQWLWMKSYIEDYARSEGCDVVRIFGRKGWARLMPDYSVSKVVLERRL